MKLLAQIDLPGGLGKLEFPKPVGGLDSPRGIGEAVMAWMIGIAGTLAIVALIYSGIMYITAGANQEQAEKAKKNMGWAVMGIIFVALAAVLVFWVNQMLTTDRI